MLLSLIYRVGHPTDVGMTPVEMRGQAELMRRHAAAADDAGIRAQYFKLASDWEKLAADAEELARSPEKHRSTPRSS